MPNTLIKLLPINIIDEIPRDEEHNLWQSAPMPVRLFAPSYHPFFLLLTLCFHLGLSDPCLLLIMVLSFLHSLSIRHCQLPIFIATSTFVYAAHLAVSFDPTTNPSLFFITMFPTLALTIPVTFDLTQIAGTIH
jgi:hypothetical protein